MRIHHHNNQEEQAQEQEHQRHEAQVKEEDVLLLERMTNVSIVPADKKNKEELLVEGRGDVDAHDNSNDDDDTKKSSSMTIICDAGYGFPRAKRPRRERIGAVSRQLYNYLIWKKQQSPPQQSSQPSIVNNNDVHLHMMGSMEDWKCIQDRIQELLLSTTTNNTGNNSTTDSINNNNNNNNNNIEYLCPLAFPKMIANDIPIALSTIMNNNYSLATTNHDSIIGIYHYHNTILYFVTIIFVKKNEINEKA